jgi:hypothetical protein
MPSMAVRLPLLFFVAYVSGRQHTSSPASRTQHYPSNSAPNPATTAIVLLPRNDPVRPLTNSATCGYTSGLWYSAVTYGEEHSCTYYTEPYSAPNFGCCSSGQECEYVSTCVDYSAGNSMGVGRGVLLSNEGFYWYVKTCLPR